MMLKVNREQHHSVMTISWKKHKFSFVSGKRKVVFEFILSKSLPPTPLESPYLLPEVSPRACSPLRPQFPSGWRPRGRSPQGGARPACASPARRRLLARAAGADPLPPRRQEARSPTRADSPPRGPGAAGQARRGALWGARPGLSRALPERGRKPAPRGRRFSGRSGLGGRRRRGVQSLRPRPRLHRLPAGGALRALRGPREGRWGGALHRSSVSASSRAWRVASFGDSYPRHGPPTRSSARVPRVSLPDAVDQQRRWSFWS